MFEISHGANLQKTPTKSSEWQSGKFTHYPTHPGRGTRDGISDTCDESLVPRPKYMWQRGRPCLGHISDAFLSVSLLLMVQKSNQQDHMKA